MYTIVLVNSVELGHGCEIFSVTDSSLMGEPWFYEWRCSGTAGMREHLVTRKNSDRGRFTRVYFLFALNTEIEGES